MSNFQQKFKGKLSYMPKNGLLQSKDIHRSMEVMKIEDQYHYSKLPPKVPDSIKKGLGEKGKDIQKYKVGSESQKLKLPQIKPNEKTQSNFFIKQPQQQQLQKKIYSADHSKIIKQQKDNELEFLQRQHLQYLNRIEQLYMIK